MTTYTAIINREEGENWERDRTPSRMEILWSHNSLTELREKMASVVTSYAEDNVKIEAEHPEYTFLVDGVPLGELDNPEVEEKIYELEHSVELHYDEEIKRIKVEKAREANDLRLARERKERERKKQQEIELLTHLRAKYPNRG